MLTCMPTLAGWLVCRDSVFEPLLEAIRNPSEEDSKYLGNLDTQQLANIVFEAGAAPDLLAKNRQVLYELSNDLEKAQRKRQKREMEMEAQAQQLAQEQAQQQQQRRQKGE